MGFESAVRNVESIELPRIGKVVACDGIVPWLVVDASGEPLEPIRRYLSDFVACGNSAGSVRSYAFDLHRWWRFLTAIDVSWDAVTSAEVRDFVLWLQAAKKPSQSSGAAPAKRAGTINPVTRKQYLTDKYAPRTIRHSNAVLRAFYEFWIERGEGPLLNPVPLERRHGRANAHHNPLEPFRAEGRLRYNPRVPKRQPRSMPDERWQDLFGAMPSDRDRAILALGVSTGARAGELLGLRVGDLDWGDQLIRVTRKGTRAQQWLPASPEAFVWLRLYLNELDIHDVDAPVWQTLRRRQTKSGLEQRPLTYDALRAVLRRANEHLGANWTMHDLRHTAALRMVRDGRLSLRDVQTILGHACLTTTQIYLDEDDAQVIARVQGFLGDQAVVASQPTSPAPGYRAGDLDILFGGQAA